MTILVPGMYLSEFPSFDDVIENRGLEYTGPKIKEKLGLQLSIRRCPGEDQGEAEISFHLGFGDEVLRLKI